MNEYFSSDYEQLIYVSRYARWSDEDNRREYWPETVDRYMNFMEEHLLNKLNYKLPKKLKEELTESILNFDLVPSMRAIMTAGKALERSNIAGFNCSYLPIDDVKSFDEGMYILLNGTGVGYSVEQKYVNKLPEIPDELYQSDTTIVVKDSKEGWAKAYRQLIALLYSGEIPKWDTSRIRAAGSRLKTFGGRASGPAPLEDLFRFTVEIFRTASGRKLTSLECHDLMCKVASVVVVGGVRRSAMISLSDLDDYRLRSAKSGEWWVGYKHRALANNSAVYNEKPTAEKFLEEWMALIESRSGERGIFNREGIINQVTKNDRRDSNYSFGTNPCGEIILRPYSFCNLTEVVIRADDTEQELMNKVRLATILGTFQSTLTDYPYLRKIWQKNAEEERLLGVSLTGIMDNVLTNGTDDNLDDRLRMLKTVAIETNELYSGKLNINQSVAITTVKPSGTVSQLVNSSSGIHPRFASYYVRTVRADNKDPLTQFLIDAGIPNEPEVNEPDKITVFSFPIKAPDNSIKRENLTAIEMLDIWLTYKNNWCEHNPSVTINVKDDEWIDVGAWVYRHFDDVTGISFLPYDGGSYVQAPYQEIDEDTYNNLVDQMPKGLDWSILSMYEKSDTTTGSQELACSGGVCEVVDLNKSG